MAGKGGGGFEECGIPRATVGEGGGGSFSIFELPKMRGV